MAVTEHDAGSQWVLVSAIGGTLGLLRIGELDFDTGWSDGEAPSLRKRLDLRSRTLLLESIRTAVASGTDVAQTVNYRGIQHHVEVILIWSPNLDDPAVLGAHAAFSPSSGRLPPRPPIGTWHWVVRRDGGGNYGSRPSSWNDDLYEMYGMSKADVDPAVGPSQTWLATCLAPHSAAAMKLAIDSGISSAPRTLQLLGYDIIRQDTGALQHMRMYATSLPEFEHPDALVLHGFSRLADQACETIAVQRVAPRLEGLVAAILSLADDVAIAAVDLTQDFIFERTPNWSALGLARDTDSLSSLATGSELAKLRHYLHTAALSSSPWDPLRVSVINGGGTRLFRVRAVAADVNLERGRYVVLAASPLDNRSVTDASAC